LSGADNWFLPGARQFRECVIDYFEDLLAPWATILRSPIGVDSDALLLRSKIITPSSSSSFS